MGLSHLWHAFLLEISEAIGALRHSSRATKFKSDWDKPLAEALSKDTLKDLRTRISPAFLQNRLRCLREKRITEEPSSD